MSPLSDMPKPGRRFVIMGLPRSGTTYLMTLLNAHARIHCSGEQFNPYAIVGIAGDTVVDPEVVLARDAKPVRFMEAFFADAALQDRDRVGLKFMIGHNVWALNAILADPSLTLIYVHRANKLAQVSSLIKAVETRKWAQDRADGHVARKIDATPQKISHRWHEYATTDRLFMHLFRTLPHRRLAVEYRGMFAPGFNDALCDFLGVAHDPDMKSPLIKQGSNDILDRFEHPGPIKRYFTKIGRPDWLDPEL